MNANRVMPTGMTATSSAAAVAMATCRPSVQLRIPGARTIHPVSAVRHNGTTAQAGTSA